MPKTLAAEPRSHIATALLSVNFGRPFPAFDPSDSAFAFSVVDFAWTTTVWAVFSGELASLIALVLLKYRAVDGAGVSVAVRAWRTRE
jgi:hypothetical protein